MGAHDAVRLTSTVMKRSTLCAHAPMRLLRRPSRQRLGDVATPGADAIRAGRHPNPDAVVRAIGECAARCSREVSTDC